MFLAKYIDFPSSAVNIKITLKGDNQFYSQRHTSFFPDRLADQSLHSAITNIAKKTGMGSSASLVVSFLASIRAYFDLKFHLHAYCQLLNAFIQDKVGSGFDIAASLFGT